MSTVNPSLDLKVLPQAIPKHIYPVPVQLQQLPWNAVLECPECTISKVEYRGETYFKTRYFVNSMDIEAVYNSLAGDLSKRLEWDSTLESAVLTEEGIVHLTINSAMMKRDFFYKKVVSKSDKFIDTRCHTCEPPYEPQHTVGTLCDFSGTHCALVPELQGVEVTEIMAMDFGGWVPKRIVVSGSPGGIAKRIKSYMKWYIQQTDIQQSEKSDIVN